MAYRLHADESPTDALRRIGCDQIDKALDDLDDSDLDLHETVHEVRKRGKKIRGLIRLFRKAFPDYRAENVWFRDAARRLSDLRDAATLVECCDALLDRFEGDIDDDAFADLRDALAERRDATADAADTDELLERTHDAFRAAASRAGRWELDTDGDFEAVAGGLKKVYRRARDARSTVVDDPTVENLHEWRKRAKYHRDHLRLLRELWQPVLDPLRDQAKLLSDRLGDDHDLALLRRTLADERGRFAARDVDAMLGLIDRRRAELQAWSLPLGRRLFADGPGRAVARIGALWEAWRTDRQLAAALPAPSLEVS